MAKKIRLVELLTSNAQIKRNLLKKEKTMRNNRDWRKNWKWRLGRKA